MGDRGAVAAVQKWVGVAVRGAGAGEAELVERRPKTSQPCREEKDRQG
ncbi:hypothetical protein [Amycolatopsis echigonensis]|uniref:Uncharacterized protein n=1 Tax=Amycolatopsis echigonensis TaxID=2576905 RepID=A0A2N3WGJ6_9PSEU|nr:MULTISPECIES: hypothetical protein [Amycolatopsis]MBB2498054.1 hypothetical protein [Amycolatopsis echigonensis]PKV92979.1 hypothetical protein ATK30_3814 [Amycolatopsis niigatensis]